MAILTFTANANKTVTIEGNIYTVTAADSGNMKQLVIDGITYVDFPVTVVVDKNITISASGEDDKTVTINYTGTKPPVITNT